MTLKEFSTGLLGLGIFAAAYWLFWAYALADIAWPVSSVAWSIDGSVPARILLLTVALAGGVGSFIAGSTVNEW